MASGHRWCWGVGQHFTENVPILEQSEGEKNSSQGEEETDAEVEQGVETSPLQDFPDKGSIRGNSQEDEEPF